MSEVNKVKKMSNEEFQDYIEIIKAEAQTKDLVKKLIELQTILTKLETQLRGSTLPLTIKEIITTKYNETDVQGTTNKEI